jgi:hypothetical protein
MGEGVNHIVKRGEVQIVQALQSPGSSPGSVQVVENGKRGSICSNRFATGFFYFKLPDGIERLENLCVEVASTEEQTGNQLSYKFTQLTLNLR